MRTRISTFMGILTVAVAITTASATVNISMTSVTTSTFRIVWNSGADVEAINEFYWMGGPNLTLASAIGSCNNGDVEYFGNAWAPPDPNSGGAVLVGGGTTGGRRMWTYGQGNNSGSVLIASTSTACPPSSAGVAVTTTYSFDDTVANKNQFVMQRQFSFGKKPFNHSFRPYIPRFSLGLGFTDVLYPAIGGVLAGMDSRNCPTGCTGPFPAPGAAPLDAQWDSSQQWYAIHNPATGQGVVVMRQRAVGADGSLVPSQLWIDFDGGSNTNSSSFLLMSPVGGFLGDVTEKETFCFYDQNSWTPSLTPPAGCQPRDNSDWPQWGHDAGHTGYNPGEKVLGPSNVGKLTGKWALFNYNPMPGLPFAIANGMLYSWGDFGLGPGLYAFNAITGNPQPIWVVRLDQLAFERGTCLDPRTSLAVGSGIVYLACPMSPYGWVFAINATTGVIERPGMQGDFVFTPADGVLYLTGWQYVAARNFYQPVDWLFELGYLDHCLDYFFCAPNGFAAVDKGVAGWNYDMLLPPNWEYYGSGFLAMNAEDGSVRWNRNPGGDNVPIAAGGAFYLVQSGNLVALNEQDGTQLWSLPGTGAPVISGAMGYAGCGADLCAFTTANGKVQWRTKGGGSPAAVANGVVYANSAYDAKTGKLLGGAPGGIVANGMVYWSDGYGVIFASGLPK